jgi:hypothetical protein
MQIGEIGIILMKRMYPSQHKVWEKENIIALPVYFAERSDINQ